MAPQQGPCEHQCGAQDEDGPIVEYTFRQRSVPAQRLRGGGGRGRAANTVKVFVKQEAWLGLRVTWKEYRCEVRDQELVFHEVGAGRGREPIEFPLAMTQFAVIEPDSGRQNCFLLYNPTVHDRTGGQMIVSTDTPDEMSDLMRDINHNITTKCGGQSQIFVNLV